MIDTNEQFLNINMLIDYLNRIKKKTSQIVNSKFKFHYPKKNDLVIYDYDAEEKIRKILLMHEEYTILPHSGIIYLPILIHSLYFIRYGLHAYKIAFLKNINAKFIINWHDDYVKLSIPARIANCKLIMIQNGYRDKKCIPYSKKKWEIDYYIVMCENWKEWVSDKISAQFFTFGSIINNQFRYMEDFPDVKKILWISDYYDEQTKQDGFGLSRKKWEKEFLEPTRMSLKIIKEFCNNNDLKLEILLRQKGKSLKENSFYKELGINIGIDKDIYNNDYWNINYVKSTSESIIVGCHETLGYELFGRGFRVAFFNFRSHINNNESYRFAWPKKVNDIGKFWCNIPDHKHLYDTLDYLKNVSSEEWKKQLELYSGVMYFDQNNKNLKKFLISQGIKVNI